MRSLEQKPLSSLLISRTFLAHSLILISNDVPHALLNHGRRQLPHPWPLQGWTRQEFDGMYENHGPWQRRSQEDTD